MRIRYPKMYCFAYPILLNFFTSLKGLKELISIFYLHSQNTKIIDMISPEQNIGYNV